MIRLLSIGVAAAVGAMFLMGSPAAVSRAQDGPALVLTPDSGPCDATIQATGSGFPPDSAITFSLNRPHSEGYFASIGSTVSDAAGEFSAAVTLGEVGCTVASRDDGFDDPGEAKELGLTAHVDPVAGVFSSARYTYTTIASVDSALTATAEAPTTASGTQTPTPQLTIAPPSGPCDATIQASGKGYAAGARISISILRPDSEGPFGTLAVTVASAAGDFAVDVPLGAMTCEVAERDLELVSAGEPQDVAIAARGSPAGSGSSVVLYEYTTTRFGQMGGASTTQDPAPSPAASTPTTPVDAEIGGGDGDDSFPWVWVGVGAAIVVLLGAGTLMLIRRRHGTEV
jgi:hypothetical protein